MKRGIISVRMLTLILTSMLSGAFVVKQSFAKEVEDGLLEDDFAKSVSNAASGSGAFTCNYQLNGITGTYAVSATDGTNGYPHTTTNRILTGTPSQAQRQTAESSFHQQAAYTACT